MYIYIKILIMAIIGGVIGYITNVLAIKLLFKPLKPIKIPLTSFEFIGLIPKRRDEIAKKIGQMIDKELLDTEDILENVVTEADKERIIELLKARVSNILVEKLSFIPNIFFEKINNSVFAIIDQEASKSIDELKNDLMNEAKNRISIENLVIEKIEALDLEKIEELIIDIARVELKHIEVLGFILGSLIGLVQGLISIFI